MIKVKLSHGYLIVEEKGSEGDYPGVFISYDIEGDPDEAILCACVEEDTYTDRLLIETYSSNKEEPVMIYDYFNEEEVEGGIVWD